MTDISTPCLSACVDEYEVVDVVKVVSEAGDGCLADGNLDAVTDPDRPPTPFNLTVRPFGNGLHIAWSVPTSDRPADYHIVEYRTVGQWVPLTDRLASCLNAYNWTTASRGATYYFRVTGFYDETSDGAPAADDRDDEQSPLPWQQGLPSAVVTIETGGKCCSTTGVILAVLIGRHSPTKCCWPTSLVVEVQRSVRYVCLSVCLYNNLNDLNYVDNWHAGSSRSKVKVMRQSSRSQAKM